ncbi:MAG: hypothetical protein ACJ8AH_26390 [Stellaceae bacterium]
MKSFHCGLRAPLMVAYATVSLLLANFSAGLCAEPSPNQAAFDSPEVQSASDVVPPALLAGPHYRVDPAVRTFAFMNQHSVTSDYGAFTAPSDVRLHGRGSGTDFNRHGERKRSNDSANFVEIRC